MSSKLVKAIEEFEYPNDRKSLEIFLGLIKYLSKFIPNASQIKTPLRELLKNNEIFQFNHSCKKIVEQLSQLFVMLPFSRYFVVNIPL